jgi:hypothetical protein
MSTTARRAWVPPALMIAYVVALVWIGRGFVSSNDGSHVALARALVVHRQSTIDPDVALTLWVDRAERDGHHYSDRPPGTAFAALPAIWIGAQLDPTLRDRAVENGALVIISASDPFAQTYAARAKKHGRAPALVQYQGTALLARLQAALMGLLGLVCLERWLRREGYDRRARTAAITTVAVATLWGPYSTVLFSHVTSGALWCAMLLACAAATEHGRRAWWLAGACAAWAVACDYVLVVPIAIQLALLVPRRGWPHVLVGAAPLVLVTGAYHQAAFGAWWSVGYDHHASFEFTRTRVDTFSGNPMKGLWTLLGLGHDAGILAQSPILFVGVAALVAAKRWRVGAALLPWLLLLALHRTPEGGATADHRYLVPAIPIVGLGFAEAWRRWIAPEQGLRRSVALVCILLAALSMVLVWARFFAWRDG